ncbi:chemotaxis protein CheV [Mucispirillum schaedleri]|uniref:chemotaxis protein CheV n=1 Tax=Mucispirillum schaedleri TaxID=248039 RepID=UPI001F56CF4E|nr:chemotaxis protein [Mucispirillum schaedleri]
MALNHGILLETGTNEFEIVEFIINNGNMPYHFCINVAKVREVIIFPETTVQVPDAHPSIIGTANIRQNLVPIINLGQWIGVRQQDPDFSKSKVIVTYFNGAYNGFLVDEVIRIHRITWSDIKDYSAISDLNIVDSVLGVVTIDGRLIQMLDFEKIVAEINPITMVRETTEIDMSRYYDRNGKTIFLAEDSPTIRKLLQSSFTRAGYNTMSFENGIDLLTRLRREKPALIITDLEMPGGSGDYVVRKTREKEIFNDVPILVFSSMVSVENERKLLNIGASRFIGKPDLSDLIKAVDEFVLDKKGIIIHKEIVQ